MDHREELHAILETALGSDHVYFQPPASVRMTYPAIVYFLETFPASYANDDPYKVSERYSVTFITRDPVSKLPKQMSQTHGFSFDRHYSADNLHHYVFTYLRQ